MINKDDTMKKYKILSYLLLLFMILNTGIVFAEDYSFDNQIKFTVPDGYSLYNNSNKQAIFVNENSMSAVGIKINVTENTDEIISEFEGLNFSIIDKKSVKINSDNIDELKFKNSEGYFLYLYKFNKEGDDYLIGYLSSSSNFTVEESNNPVSIIYSSLST